MFNDFGYRLTAFPTIKLILNVKLFSISIPYQFLFLKTKLLGKINIVSIEIERVFSFVTI